MGEPLGVLAEPVPVERLDRRDDPRVELPPALLQQPAVGDLVRERVLERVLEIRIEPGLVDELGRLQPVEPAAERLVGQLGDRLEQCQRHVLADDRGDLQEALVLRGKPVDAGRQDRLDGGGNLDRLDRLRQPIPASLPHQRLRLHQRPDRLLQEERVPAPDEALLERRQPGIVAEERLQQLGGGLGRERVQPQLAVVASCHPSRAGTRDGSSRAAADAPSPGYRPGHRVTPASRCRSSGGPRRSGGGLARALPAAAVAARRRACAGVAASGRASATRRRPRARRAGPATPAASAPARGRA